MLAGTVQCKQVLLQVTPYFFPSACIWYATYKTPAPFPECSDRWCNALAELAHIDARTILLLSSHPQLVTTTTAAIGGMNEHDLKSAGELLLRFTAAAPTFHSRSPGASNPSGRQNELRRFEFTAKTSGCFSSDDDEPGVAVTAPREPAAVEP